MVIIYFFENQNDNDKYEANHFYSIENDRAYQSILGFLNDDFESYREEFKYFYSITEYGMLTENNKYIFDLSDYDNAEDLYQFYGHFSKAERRMYKKSTFFSYSSSL